MDRGRLTARRGGLESVVDGNSLLLLGQAAQLHTSRQAGQTQGDSAVSSDSDLLSSESDLLTL